MSYDVELRDGDGEAVMVEAHEEGGTYQVGGTNRARLNVTYNYSEVYSVVGFSLRDLHGKRAGDTLEQLTELVKKLGTRRFENYWAPTPGNAGHALNILLGWAKAHPDATWNVE